MHNLEMIDGKASFVSSLGIVNKMAWHGQGTYVPDAMTSAEAIKLANMDYEVVKVPMIETVGEEQFVSEDAFTIQRADRTGKDAILGRVGAKYTPTQNVDCFDFFDSIIGKGEAFFETAMVLGKGERIAISCTLPDHFNINVGDKDWVKPYLFLTNSHDGKGMVTAAITPVRIVCNNTLQMALGNCMNKVAFRHTSGVIDKLKNSQKVLGIRDMLLSELTELLPVMGKKKISDKLKANS